MVKVMKTINNNFQVGNFFAKYNQALKNRREIFEYPGIKGIKEVIKALVRIELIEKVGEERRGMKESGVEMQEKREERGDRRNIVMEVIRIKKKITTGKIKVISKPSREVHISYKELEELKKSNKWSNPRIKYLISTSKGGIVSEEEAIRHKVGGKVIAKIYY